MKKMIIIIIMKKKIFVWNRFWAIAQIILWERRFLYCNIEIVLQD